MDRTLNHAKNTLCFLDDILIVSKGEKHEHEKLVLEDLKTNEQKKSSVKIRKVRVLSDRS